MVGDTLEGWVTSKSNQSINQTQHIKGTEAPSCFQCVAAIDGAFRWCIQSPQLADLGKDEHLKDFFFKGIPI